MSRLARCAKCGLVVDDPRFYVFRQNKSYCSEACLPAGSQPARDLGGHHEDRSAQLALWLSNQYVEAMAKCDEAQASGNAELLCSWSARAVTLRECARRAGVESPFKAAVGPIYGKEPGQ